MAAKPPEGSHALDPETERLSQVRAYARESELRDAVRREDLWLKVSAALLATVTGLLIFYGRDVYSDVKNHTAQLAALTERVNGVREQVDKIASDTEQNGRSLAEIKGFLQARLPISNGNSPQDKSSRH